MDPLAKGAALEQQLGEYFRLSGYAVRQNVVMEGKSGGRHEIDVLADKSDGVITIRVAVECKAWQQRVGKEVVAKLAMVMADAGINKGVVVALNGWHQGAEATARSFGIDLWGPDDLREKLGAVSLATLNQAGGRRVAVDALAGATLPLDRLQSVLAARSQGVLGLGAEHVDWTELVWLPFHLVKVSQARPTSEFLRRPRVQAVATWNLYSALDDRLWKRLSQDPVVSATDVAVAMPARTVVKGIARRMADSTRKWNEVVTDRAKERYRAQLRALGIETPVSQVTVDGARLVAHPFLVGLLSRRGRHRFVAINAETGQADTGVGEALTQESAFVQTALGR